MSSTAALVLAVGVGAPTMAKKSDDGARNLGGVERVAVCHELGNGSWLRLDLPAVAAAKHLREYGDRLPGGPVPETADVFDEDCTPVPAPEPEPEPQEPEDLFDLCMEQEGTFYDDVPYPGVKGCMSTADIATSTPFTERWDTSCALQSGKPLRYYAAGVIACDLS